MFTKNSQLFGEMRTREEELKLEIEERHDEMMQCVRLSSSRVLVEMLFGVCKIMRAADFFCQAATFVMVSCEETHSSR